MTSAGGSFDQLKKYTNGIFLTEDNSAVLGAAFMKDFNVIFDVDRRQLGLAKANCSYDDSTLPDDSANPKSNGNFIRGFDSSPTIQIKKARGAKKKSSVIFKKALQYSYSLARHKG